MPEQQSQTTKPEWLPLAEKPEFLGFEHLQSNVTYTPNQFFDVCLPHYSRGVVRLVGYIIYRTLAWSDRDGRPMSEQHEVAYQELIAKAGISRGALSEAITEAVKGNFITIKRGWAHQAGKKAESAIFELKWSNNPKYIKDPKQFNGFFEGDGNRTYIPNQFFTRILPNEPLAIIKVVGSVIRFSIGFQVKRGFRRQEVALSYREIQRFSNIVNPTHLTNAIKHSLQSNYIRLVKEGYFDPNAGKNSKATVYSLKWTQDKIGDSDANSNSYKSNGSKRIADNRFKKDSRNGSKRIADNRFKKDSDIEIKHINKLFKQQQDVAAAVEITDEDKASFERLRKEGFDNRTAARLASVRSLEHIEQQIAWLPKRNPTQNPLGLLRKAIEEDWPEPVNTAETITGNSPAVVFGRHFYASLGRNEGAPVAVPSRADLAATEPFVAVLLDIWPNSNQIEVWGRKFGVQVSEVRITEQYPMSLVRAIRQFGDKFVTWVRRDRERNIQRVVNQNREAYEGRFKADYLRYLTTLEAEYRITNHQVYNEFLEYRSRQKRDFEKLPNGFIRSKLLARHDTHEAVIEDFRKYFHDVLDFWAWDKQVNRQRQNV